MLATLRLRGILMIQYNPFEFFMPISFKEINRDLPLSHWIKKYITGVHGHGGGLPGSVS